MHRHVINTFGSDRVSPYMTLHVSIAKTLSFLWYIVAQLFLFSSSLNDDELSLDDLSLNVVLKPFSSIRLTLLFSLLLWNIHIGRQ